MEMSPAYLKETATALERSGFELSTEEFELPDSQGGPGGHGTRFVLHRGEQEHLVLESLVYPDEVQHYFLQLRNYHGLSCTSFPLDSWKHFTDRVEFKFYTQPESGLGLSFLLQLSG